MILTFGFRLHTILINMLRIVFIVNVESTSFIETLEFLFVEGVHDVAVDF